MYHVGSSVVCLPSNPVFSVVGEEVGVITSSYSTRSSLFISVLFPEYGSEQGSIDSSFYREATTILSDLPFMPEVNDTQLLINTSSFIKMQQILAKNIIETQL
jgi:hypothetical protein